jgi:energy-converting hydrogenase Eha subunit G
MGLLRKNIECSECNFTGVSALNPLSLALWILVVILFFVSFAIWPLFLIWPILLILLIVYPMGQTCPKCGSQASEKKEE